ncbi:MAG: DNA gyrase subunit A [Marinospirillum sp.]|uniref:DNA gyrase subunit A n=1 Tax=Marinospirillum sp. TaxID=2183934 RepID=UPI001A019403|nr:DNA gyrase subunit A [Marinospirillum sp.]MBE0507340.1 DNA gyrase subunit A [Marinospirillum sp.]
MTEEQQVNNQPDDQQPEVQGASNGVIAVAITDEMKRSYLDYAMSVIVDRALPDARDGLKPVHRRVLYAMHNLGIGPQSAYKKSARIVGEVIGKYHPHGDTAAYETAVRMAQPWSLLHPLVDGQGNFGSIDGDSPAAMRYTEMRMTRIGYQMFNDIEKQTVNFIDNYDGTEKEPEVLPLAFPNLWVNGVEGIAVGMATQVLPHNLTETGAAFKLWAEDPDVSWDALMEVMPAPDFPTGGLVHGLDGYRAALETGRGRVLVRSRYHVEDRRGGLQQIVVTEIPYQVNKSVLVEKIAELVKEKQIEGISDLRDESNKEGMRIVIEIKRDTDPEVLFMQLLKVTDLEKSFNYNTRALVRNSEGQPIPMALSLKQVFSQFYDHRIEVIQRRTAYDLEKTQERLHLLAGYLKALSRLDETLQTIRAASDTPEAMLALMTLLDIDDIQSKAILDLKLQRLTGMQIQDIHQENSELESRAQGYREILASPERQKEILINDLDKAVTAFGQSRMSEVAHGLSSITREDLIAVEDVVILATEKGYVSRLPATVLRRQNRGTRGRNLMNVGEDDTVSLIHYGSTHDYLILVTDQGQVHGLKAYQVPESKPGNKGRHYRNVFEGIAENAQVITMLSTANLEDEDASLVMLTQRGQIKRTKLNAYRNAVRANGIIGISLADDDRVIAARISRNDADQVLMISDQAKACRFDLAQVRAIGRNSQGVTGMRLNGDAKLLAAFVIPTDEIDQTDLVCVSEEGVGKRTSVTEVALKNRAIQGVACFKSNARSGGLAAAALLTQEQDLLLFNEQGGANRVSGKDITEAGRATAGSYLMRNGRVLSVLAVPALLDEPEADMQNGEDETQPASLAHDPEA